MRACLLLFALLARNPFWETKAPEQWTDDEVKELLSDSPWAQQAVDSKGDGVQVYLATARPIREAEQQLAKRSPTEDPPSSEYEDFIRENAGKQIVLAIAFSNAKAFEDAAEVGRMQERCFLKLGRKKYKMTGYFPPTPDDPHLRLAFPRTASPADKTLVFELYLPGTPKPYRLAEFPTKDLNYRGVLEY